MAAYALHAFDFRFDFATTNLALGSAARVGRAAAYTVSGENQQLATPLVLPSESFGEVAGIEVFPGTVGGLGAQYEHAAYVKLLIGGQGYDDQFWNELTAPGITPGQPDPLAAAGLRHNGMPTNFGLPMLLGGRPEECCPKIPAGKPIEIEIGCPSAVEGGVALAQPWVVRLWMAKVAGVQKLKDILQFQSAYTQQGYYDGNVMNCNFDLGDLEVHEKMPVRSKLTNNPIKNLVPEQGVFDPQEHWGKLPGGMEQDRPKMHVYSVFAKQMAPTVTNTWYQFTAAQQRVQDKMMDLYWDFTKRDALKITHIGFKQPAVGTISQLWLRRSGRELEQMFEVQRTTNPFPMPRTRSPTTLCYVGPAKLVKPLLGWNDIMSVEMKDNATAVLPWAAATPDQAAVYLRGIRYELNEKEV
jgi:hypothetical protein